jgi:hypothetical protein
MLRLIRGYYLGTPIFFLADVLFGLNIRVAFLDQWPTGKMVYYVFAFVLGILAWRKPEWTAKIGLIDSGANVLLIILSVMVWYGAVLDAAGSDFGMPVAPSSQALANFVLSSVIAGASYTLQRARALSG